MKPIGAILLVYLLSISLAGCGKEEAPPPATTPDAPSLTESDNTNDESLDIMQTIAAHWKEKTDPLSEKALANEKRDKRLLSKVVMSLSEEETADLVETLTVSPTSEEDAFEQGVLGMLVRRLGRSGERERLVALLTVNCPREVGPVTIEYSLAVAERLQRMPDAFTVLIESYRAAQNPQTKATLLTALSDALPSLREQFADDKAFV